jgi:hypothetical protein
MRATWSLFVVFVVTGAMLDACMGIGGAKSAMQASQLYDRASMTILGVIALTLAFWFTASSRGQK